MSGVFDRTEPGQGTSRQAASAMVAPTDPRVARTAHDALARGGAKLYPVSGVLGDTGHLFRTFSALQGHEAFAVHASHLPGEESLIDPDVLARLRTGQSVTAEQYATADRARQEFRDLVLRLLDEHPVLALPTVPIVAPRMDQRTVRAGDTTVETRTALLSLTSPWNMAGVPALSVPVGRVDGLPVGVQLITAAGGEERLFAIAAAAALPD